MTKQELRQIIYTDMRIDAMLHDAMNLREMAECVQSLYPKEQVQTSGVGDPMKPVDKLIDMEAKINTEINKLVDLRSQAQREFNKLGDRDRLLMELRYVHGKTWSEVADVVGVSRQYVHELHGQILQKIEIP